MTYPYGLQVGPAIGKGLPGLPRNNNNNVGAAVSAIDWAKIGVQTFTGPPFQGYPNFTNIANCEFTSDGMRVYWVSIYGGGAYVYYADLLLPYRFDLQVTTAEVTEFWRYGGGASGTAFITAGCTGYMSMWTDSNIVQFTKFNTPGKHENGSVTTYTTGANTAYQSGDAYYISPDLKTFYYRVNANGTVFKFQLNTPGDLSSKGAYTSSVRDLPASINQPGNFSPDGRAYLKGSGSQNVYSVGIPFDILTLGGPVNSLTFGNFLTSAGGVGFDSVNKRIVLPTYYQNTNTSPFTYTSGVVIMNLG